MSKKYFINNIDGVIGSAILKELTKGAGEGEDIEPVHMGTYKDLFKTEKPKGVKKILKREKPKLAKKKMLEECDVFIYDCHTNKFSDVLDTKFGVSIFDKVELEEEKVLIFISDCLVWNDTEKKVK